MEYGEINRFQSGVAVPVSALRSDKSLGIGEFADLPAFARWASSVGLDLIQILPVNDTGGDASPYSARGAFALHPVYLRIDDLPGAEVLGGELERLRAEMAGAQVVDYPKVSKLKLGLCRRIFDGLDHDSSSHELEEWIEANPWIRIHAVYAMLRERNQERSWKQWPTMRDPSAEDIDRSWQQDRGELLYQIWVQREADRQLRRAVEAVASAGVKLKGDLPILLDEDSSDVWYHRELFDLDGRAGAPPDMYAEHGQFWGFPCYRWDALVERDYDWWRDRLRQASRYYHALRIDHVLGFFRIWRIPSSSVTGMLGRFDPAIPITREELRSAGFCDDRIDVLTAVEGRVGAAYPSESAYQSSVQDPDELEAMLTRLWNRVLLDVDGKHQSFRPYWYWYQTPLYDDLGDHEKNALHELLANDAERQDELWEDSGRSRLQMVGTSTDALVCAEDLGAVPKCVPAVLDDLGILGLKVDRWCRDWDEPDQPFHDPSGYPRESVCSPSVHDASSLRAWWEEVEADRRTYWRALGREGDPPSALNVPDLEAILRRNLSANSKLCILALADLLALDHELRPEDPRHERINTPATPSAQNWRWRMPVEIEDMSAREELNVRLRELISARRDRDFS